MKTSINISKITNHKGIRWIGLGWSAFILENLIISNNRQKIIDQIGLNNYIFCYSTLSTVTTGSVLYGYIKYGRKSGPFLNKVTKSNLIVGGLIQTIGLIGLSQAIPNLQIPFTFSKEKTEAKHINIPETNFDMKLRCPFDFKTGGKKLNEFDIVGMERISRHASLWFFGIAGLGRAMSTNSIPEIIFYVFPLIFAVIGSEHQDYRYRRGSGGKLTKETEEISSNIPFLAVIRGKQSLVDVCNEMKWTNTSLAVMFGVFTIIRRIRRL